MVDQVAAQLAALEEAFRGELAGYATVERTPIYEAQGSDVSLIPFRDTSLEVGWMEFPDHEIILGAATVDGGSWTGR